MAGRNIKQLSNRTNPTLTDFLYLVAGDNDFNVTLDQLKTLFFQSESGWATIEAAANATTYQVLESTADFVSLTVEYLMKRGSRTYHSGALYILWNGTTLLYSDVWGNLDPDDLGVTLTPQISSGYFQLEITCDSSDVEPTTFNYSVVTKKPLTVS